MDMDETYDVRRYESGDRADALSLLEHTRDERFRERRDEWFDWRFLENPFTTGVALTVAEHDDGVVGLVSSVPIPMRVGAEQRTAVLHQDAIVHPEHRRRGLFSRMVSHDTEYYANRGASIFHALVNEATLEAHRKHTDGRAVSIPKYYRIDDPTALVDETKSNRATRALATLASPGVDVYNLASDALSPSAEDLEVERYDGVPASVLAAVTGDRESTRATTVRDETFYRWRFDDPLSDYVTYTASRDGAIVAGTVVETGEGTSAMRAGPLASDEEADRVGVESDAVVTQVVDVVHRDRRNDDALVALVRGVLADREGSAGTIVYGSAVSEGVLSSLGFLRDDTFPLSTLTKPLRWYVWTPRPDDWTVDGRDLSDPSNWRLSWCDVRIE